jgi:hypothetical protein
MPTPQRAEYITFVSGVTELLCGSKAIDCYDWSALFEVGESRGSNRVIPGVIGSVARAHVRGEMFAELKFRCMGQYNEENVVQSVSTRRANVLARVSQVRAFLDGATGRQLSLKLTTGVGTPTTTAVTFKAMSGLTFPTPEIADFRVLIGVPSGIVAIPA